MTEHARRRPWGATRGIAPATGMAGRPSAPVDLYRSLHRPHGADRAVEVFDTGQWSGSDQGKRGGPLGDRFECVGTTSATTITITQIRPRWHYPSQYLGLDSLKITSGQLGGLDASFCELNGQMTCRRTAP